MTTTATVPTFESLYETYYRRIYQHALRLVRHVQDAEDVTQDTFVKVYQALPSFDPTGGSITGWLYRIATRTALDHLRKARPGRVCSLDALLIEPADVEASDPQTRYNGTTEQAMTALRRLQPHYRNTLILHGMGFTLVELAAYFGKTERTVYGWLAEARQALSNQQEQCA
jgi:RNA polymerase sigma-70 factor (ECF subfamily)